MCFQGRSNSLVAGDSVAGTGAVSAADEIEPDVMGACKIVAENALPPPF
jgi:hypothetical protein